MGKKMCGILILGSPPCTHPPYMKFLLAETNCFTLCSIKDEEALFILPTSLYTGAGAPPLPAHVKVRYLVSCEQMHVLACFASHPGALLWTSKACSCF